MFVPVHKKNFFGFLYIYIIITQQIKTNIKEYVSDVKIGVSSEARYNEISSLNYSGSIHGAVE